MIVVYCNIGFNNNIPIDKLTLNKKYEVIETIGEITKYYHIINDNGDKDQMYNSNLFEKLTDIRKRKLKCLKKTI